MRPVLKAFLLLFGLAVVVAGGGLWAFINTGVSARETPGRAEEFVARRVRNMAIAGRAKSLTNPVRHSSEAMTDARAHFADHCAICHANDGSGDTPIGRALWPKAPDMRLRETQDLSDGELFWIIENGIRFTGMPAWGTEHKGWGTGKLGARTLHPTTPEADARRTRGNGSTQSTISGPDSAADRRREFSEGWRRGIAHRSGHST